MPTQTKPVLIQISDFYKISQLMFRLIFIPCDKYTLNVGWKFWLPFAVALSVPFLGIIFVHHLFVVDFDLANLCFIQSVIFYECTSISKIVYVIKSRAKLRELLTSLDEIHPSSVNQQTEHNITEWLNLTKRVIVYYALVQIGMMVNFVFIPFFGYIYEYMVTGIWKIHLPIDIWMPFNTEPAPIFYTVYVLQSWQGFFYCLQLTSCDLLLLAIVHLVCMHFQYIQRTFNELQVSNDLREISLVKDCINKQNIIIQ